MIRNFNGIEPRIGTGCFIAETAVVVGDVTIGENSSVWFGAVVRGDEHFIRIGANTNIQDNVVCHVTGGSHPLRIGDYVTVGHNAVVHGCTIGDHCVIEMGAVVMDGATVGEGSIVAAGTVVTEGSSILPRTLVAGIPARQKKELGSLDLARIDGFAQSYLELKRLYVKEKEKDT